MEVTERVQTLESFLDTLSYLADLAREDSILLRKERSAVVGWLMTLTRQAQTELRVINLCCALTGRREMSRS